MSATMSQPSLATEPNTAAFKPLRLVLAVFTILLLVSFFAHWYASQISMSRYCQQPELMLKRLNAVITESRPAGDGARREYIVAAKLGFMLPRETNEPLEAYLKRLHGHLEEHCR
jgi:hypothetical protein